ncbi:MAG: RDD family protein [Acidimicrobiales bacterium]|nr:RDD family protein [Acidimicrobiales bacterium]
MTDAEHDPVSELESATWWTRGKAIIIDAALFFGALLVPVLLVVVAVVMAWDEATDEASFTGASVGLFVVGIISGVGVFVWGGWLFGYRQGVTGSTPGKRRLKIRLVDVTSGEAPGGARGVGRWLVPGLVGGIQGIGNILQLLDYLWPLWDSRNQRLIDKVFRTRVVVGAGATKSTDDWLPSSPIS